MPKRNYMQVFIILIVGASGVGKDSLMKEARVKFANFNFVKRYITRKPDENEDNFFINQSKFDELKSKNFFISHWEAHGYNYAIAKENIKNGVNFISISRNAIADFERLYQNVHTIHIKVSDCELEKRLKKRARENSDEIAKRLKRSKQSVKAKNLIEFENKSPLNKSKESFIALINTIIPKDKLC